DFGPMEALVARYGDNRDLQDMPSSRTTRPSVVFKPRTRKRQLVPYDAARALELMGRRDPLPAIFASSTDVTDAPREIIGRGRPTIKHESASDLMRCTRNDEG
ncbi:MAG: 4Fe-4S dicluster domain-containing protein, partial [Dehalococcoidia bacterium]|nr:4Fe-4S dicluster domain-containing protein [Dehalococcoidia bacterium]